MVLPGLSSVHVSVYRKVCNASVHTVQFVVVISVYCSSYHSLTSRQKFCMLQNLSKNCKGPYQSGPSCSKLTTSLVNDSLKF